MINNILSFILILPVLFFGAVEIWSSSIVLFLVFTLGLLWILRQEYSRHRISDIEKLLLASGAAFLLYSLLQVLPLPSFILKLISSSAYEMQTFYSFGGGHQVQISLDPYKTIMESLRVTAFFIIFAVSTQNFKDRDRLTGMIKALVIFGFILSLFAIVQKATWNGKIFWFRELTLGGEPFGAFVNRNHFAGFVGMLIPLGLGLAFVKRSKEKRILFGFLTLIMTVALFFSLSRGGILSFFSGIALFALLMIQSRVQAKKVWVIGFFLIVLMTYLLYLGIDPIIDRFYKTDVTKEQRLIVWSATWDAIRDFWITGSGLGTFINIFPLYSPVETQLSIYDHAHNDYLEFILETGLIGTILLITFITLSVYSFAKSGLQGRAGILKIAAVSSASTMIVHSIFDFNLHILSNALLLSAVFGMMTALSNMSQEPEARSHKPSARVHEQKTVIQEALFAADDSEKGIEDWEKEIR